MPRQPNDPDEKADALRLAGAYHAHANAIRAPEFHVGGFFDPRDAVQVKYEMLRRVREEQAGVTEAAKLFGFSRIRYYQVLRAFRREGFAGLLPRPKGPRRAHKLSESVLAAVRARRAERPDESSADLTAWLERALALKVHPRSLERALARSKKNA